MCFFISRIHLQRFSIDLNTSRIILLPAERACKSKESWLKGWILFYNRAQLS